MVDIIEFALNGIGDFRDFEKLACEVLRNEGYPHIKPLGGGHDKGRDAIDESFFLQEGKRSVVVFQITTQETIETKLTETIGRLDEENIEYGQLTLVTSRSLTTNRQDLLKIAARDLGVELDIFERKTFVNRLSDFENGVFYRHFPDIQTQVRMVIENATEDELSPTVLVRTALAFAASPESEVARNKIIDELVLALLVHTRGEPASPAQLVSQHAKLVPQAQRLHEDQVAAALDRVAAAGLAQAHSGRYVPTDAELQRSVASRVDWARKSQTICDDTVDLVEASMRAPLDEGTRGLIQRNSLDALEVMFRSMGLVVASQLLGRPDARREQLSGFESIVDVAKRDLQPDIGNVVLAALGEILAQPNEQQAEALAAYAAGYVAASLLDVDPAVREFQITRMNQKVFILDTDFLLDCIVTDHPAHPASLALVDALIRLGSRMIVPEACVAEAAKHAEIAPRTLNYFGETIFGLTSVQARERIHNAFVSGWYHRSLTEEITFQSYMSNYYEPTAPVPFMQRVIKSILPAEVEIGEVATLMGAEVDNDEFKRLELALRELIGSSRKSTYRTEEEMNSLARTDAMLYAAAMTHERRTGAERKGKALGGSCYLITSSSRFSRAVDSAFNTTDEISARPSSIAGLLRLITKTGLTAKQFVALFDNPLLQHVVLQCREDVERLLDAGLSTRGKSLARLTWDLDKALHQRITEVHENERLAQETMNNAEEEQLSGSYLDLVEEATLAGYSPLPSARASIEELRHLRAAYADVTKANEEVNKRLEELQFTIRVFGRRKQRHLQRIARGEKHPTQQR